MEKEAEESAASILNGQKWSKRNGKRVAKKIREGVGCLLRHLNLSLSLCVCVTWKFAFQSANKEKRAETETDKTKQNEYRLG